MTAAWMIYALAIGALVSVAAVVAEWALKSAQRPVRFVWITAIAATTILTIVAPLRFEQNAPVNNAGMLNLPVTANVIEKSPSALEQMIGVMQSSLQHLVAPAERIMTAAGAAPAIVNRSAAAFWIVSSTFALALLLVVYTRSRRESARWPKLQLWGNNVRVAPDVGPAVIGMAPPEIVIPEWVLERNEQEQRLVLQHESEHVRAHDPLVLMIGCVAVALMPWHAALWFMWSRLRLAVELDCDRRVLSRGVKKPAYGELLVALSSQRPWNSLTMPAFSWGSSQLEKRIVAMTTRPGKFVKARLLVGASAVAFAFVAACRSELPTASDIAAMDATTATAKVGRIADSVYMTVDDKHVTEAEAKAIPAADIASVEVLKKADNPGVAEVRIKLLPDSARKGDDNGRARFKVVRDSTASVNAAAGARDSTQLREVTIIDPRGEALARSAIGVSQTLPDTAPATGSAPSAQGCVNGHIEGGTGARVRVRAQQSISLACAPMIIVDGVIVASTSFESINPERIESIEVIKGAAAQNLYGSRAANGVISIKLKK